MQMIRFCVLSASRNFQTTITILSKIDKTKISFSVREWNNFMAHIKNLFNEYFENDNYRQNIFVDINSDKLITLHAASSMGSKIIKLTSTAQLPSKTLLE